LTNWARKVLPAVDLRGFSDVPFPTIVCWSAETIDLESTDALAFVILVSVMERPSYLTRPAGSLFVSLPDEPLEAERRGRTS